MMTLIHLCANGVSVLIESADDAPPAILHWGEDLGAIDAESATQVRSCIDLPVGTNAPDVPLRPALLMQAGDGWSGRPSVQGAFADGSGFSPKFTTTAVAAQNGGGDAQPVMEKFKQMGSGSVEYTLEADTGLAGVLTVELTAQGLLRCRMKLTNAAAQPYQLSGLCLALPVPLDAVETLDFAGRWGKERVPQWQEITVGTHLREGRKGRTGADAAYVLHAGERGFNFGSGKIWALHTAWSGNHVTYLERTYSGVQVLGGGELLLPGECTLEPGDSYTSPFVYASFGHGLDQVAARFHQFMRARPQHPKTPRPVTLNVWEAVYFDHDLDKLKRLADIACEVGVERYVLDDGWFGARRSDHAGLGDWVVSKDVWPHGLRPLSDYVKSLGMKFGLWFEPEMVNLDSDVARAHPEWVMQAGSRMPIPSRNQQVLNLAIPQAYAHVRDQMVRVIEDADVSYIKWDHNRDLIDAGYAESGKAAFHAQTLAAYALMDELKARFPELEIESCSSGGGRVDLEVLQHADRVWVSDCIDPLERQQMNRWTAQLIPLEMMGSHIASEVSHTTGRTHSLSFRAVTALFGHLGIEWDLEAASPADRQELHYWLDVYKQHRDLLSTGRLVRADRGEDSVWVTGVVAQDQAQALYQMVSVDRSAMSPRGCFTFPGLDPHKDYRVRLLMAHTPPSGFKPPKWLEGSWPNSAAKSAGNAPAEQSGRAYEVARIRGSLLSEVGLAVPSINPEQALLFEVSEAVR